MKKLLFAVLLFVPFAFAQVEIVETVAYEGMIGPVVIGVVENTGSSPVQYVEVISSFYDSADGFIGSGTGYAALEVLLPGEASPFTVMGVNVEGELASYDATTQWMSATTTPPRPLTITSSRLQENVIGYSVVGQIRNDGDTPLQYVEILATGYGQAGELAAIGTGYASLDVLQPGQTSPFEVLIINAVMPVTEVVLQAQGMTAP